LTLLVATLPAQGPASQSQINLNDYIHELNGLTVHSMSVQDVVNEILVRTFFAPMRCSAGPPMLLVHDCADGFMTFRAGPEWFSGRLDCLRPRASFPVSPAAEGAAAAAAAAAADAATPPATAAAHSATAARGGAAAAHTVGHAAAGAANQFCPSASAATVAAI